MSPFEVVAVLVAGAAAGAINALVGAGTLITFSTLVALGLPPLTANVSNTVGIVAGSVSGALGYRDRLVGQGRRLAALLPASLVGAVIGALLLLRLPPAAFRAIVPALILLSVVLVVLQPRIRRRVAAGRAAAPARDPGGEPGRDLAGDPAGGPSPDPSPDLSPDLGTEPSPEPSPGPSSDPGPPGGPDPGRVGPGSWLAVLGTGVYGGYFGAAQGVLLLGVLGTWVDHDLQRVNAIKNVLAGATNALAAALFIVLADVDWEVAGLILVGSLVGGWVGARVGTRLPEPVLRAVIVVVGLVAVAILVVR
jgi:uncharacterized protein